MPINRNTLTERFRDGAVVLDLASLEYYELDRVGAAMWEALRASDSTAGAHESLCDQFAADPKMLKEDLDAFLVGLVDLGLAVAEGAPSTPDTGPLGDLASPGAVPTVADRYLDLLCRSLTGVLNRDPGTFGEFHLGLRAQGRDMAQAAQTLVGLTRLSNIRDLASRVLDEEIPGDFAEAGVWRGGSTILMRGVLAARGVTDRTVWVADSFAGLPDVNPAEFPVDAELAHLSGQLAVSQAEVRASFDRYGLLDDQVRFLPGLFADTLPTAPIESLALLRLDGDYYESTMDTLINLYPKVSPGGFVVIDDWVLPPCRAAVRDYLRQHSIEADIVPIDWAGAWFRVPGTAVTG